MDRKIVFGVGALALALGTTVGTGAAGAASTPVTLTGAMTCSLAGSYHFSPGLDIIAGQKSTVTVKAKLSNCSGPGSTNGSVTVVSGHLVATASATIANSWGAVSGGAPLPALTGTIKWKATGGHVMATNVTLDAQAISYDTGTNVISLYDTPLLTGGSYAGQSASTGGETANGTGTKLSSMAAMSGVKVIAFGKGAGNLMIGA